MVTESMVSPCTEWLTRFRMTPACSVVRVDTPRMTSVTLAVALTTFPLSST